MRVHKIHLHNRAFERDRLVRVELGGKGMVGRRNGHRQRRRSQNRDQFAVH